MNKTKNLILVIIVGLFFSGCSANRMIEGPEKYETKEGKPITTETIEKVSGDGLTDTELERKASIFNYIDNLQKKNIEVNKKDFAVTNINKSSYDSLTKIDENGKLIGWAINTTQHDVTVKVFNEDGSPYTSFNLLSNFVFPIYSFPGTYYVVYDKGEADDYLKKQKINVSTGKETPYPTRLNNKVVVLNGYFFIDYKYKY